MNKDAKKALILIAVGIIAILLIACLVKVGLVAEWNAEAADTNLSVDVSGTTELLGPDGEPIRLALIAKLGILPLSFFVESSEVTAMRVTVSWTASGQDVDWSTLKITLTASGTGGYQKSYTTSYKTGSKSFILPITVDQLGRTPSSGETITWQMTINVKGEVVALTGEKLTATLPKPIISQVKTVWYEPSFTITASQSTTTESGTSSGGCGPPGHHVVWVYGVTDTAGIKKIIPDIMRYTLISLIVAEAVIAYSLRRKKTETTK